MPKGIFNLLTIKDLLISSPTHLRIKVHFLRCHWEMKCGGLPVNLVKREVLLRDLHVACGILFPIEKEEKHTSILIFIILCDIITLQNAFNVKFISLNPLSQL